MERNLKYMFSLIPGILALAGNISGGWFTLANFIFSLVILGILEVFLGNDRSNGHTAKSDPFPTAILYGHVLLHTAVVASLFYGIFNGKLQGYFILTAALSSAVEAGSGAIVIAHELVHKMNVQSRIAGKYMLAISGNIYFYVHHLRIHHKYVGMARDAATARKGESLYAFAWRTVWEQLVQAWDSEANRLQKVGKTPISFQNEIVLNLLLQFLILCLIGTFCGLTGLLVYFFYIIVANFLLEYVNYIEHYGLIRNADEKVGYNHSWNSDKKVSRFMLIDLSRHADHHFYPSKPYHILNTTENGPVLPGGYASMILPALIPPWWFATMHQALEKYSLIKEIEENKFNEIKG
ncbi:MAG: alkane 1-monooxygenase [Bacteroidetes bacterium]|nr:alkane 1-monooxygenase [Bacteroidota bacterium]